MRLCVTNSSYVLHISPVYIYFAVYHYSFLDFSYWSVLCYMEALFFFSCWLKYLLCIRVSNLNRELEWYLGRTLISHVRNILKSSRPNEKRGFHNILRYIKLKNIFMIVRAQKITLVKFDYWHQFLGTHLKYFSHALVWCMRLEWTMIWSRSINLRLSQHEKYQL